MQNKISIPEPIEALIDAANSRDQKKFLSGFSDHAILTDEGSDYREIAAIERWSDEKLIGANVTIEPINVTEYGDETVVTAKIDGEFDKTGLPDPFIMRLHFVVSDSKVDRLTFRLP